MKKYFARLVRVSPAMVVAMLALLVALGGVSTAAQITKLPQACSGEEEAEGASRPARKARSPWCFPVFHGVRSDRGGPRARKASRDPAGPITAAAPAGVTLRGNYALSQTGSTNFAVNAFSFTLRLSAAPVPHYINVGAVPPADCPGTALNPQANAGHLCVYEANATNTTNRGVFNAESAGGSIGFASREGSGIFMYPATTSQAYVWGSWAVTSAGTSAASAGQSADGSLAN